jgi:hypothetical protein
MMKPTLLGGMSLAAMFSVQLGYAEIPKINPQPNSAGVVAVRAWDAQLGSGITWQSNAKYLLFDASSSGSQATWAVKGLKDISYDVNLILRSVPAASAGKKIRLQVGSESFEHTLSESGQVNIKLGSVTPGAGDHAAVLEGIDAYSSELMQVYRIVLTPSVIERWWNPMAHQWETEKLPNILGGQWSNGNGWFPSTPPLRDVDDARLDRKGYVIITTEALKNGLEKLDDFIAHKESLGFTVYVATENDFGVGHGVYAADNIRTWLRNNYESKDLLYALMLGDADIYEGTVPMAAAKGGVDRFTRQAVVDSGEAYDEYEYTYSVSATDHYYVDLEHENIDANGNGVLYDGGDFGQSGAGHSGHWDVLVGRIQYAGEESDFGTMADVDAIFQKIIDYETETDTSWRYKPDINDTTWNINAAVYEYAGVEYKIRGSVGEGHSPVDFKEWTNNHFLSNYNTGYIRTGGHGTAIWTGGGLSTSFAKQYGNNSKPFLSEIGSCEACLVEYDDNLCAAQLRYGSIGVIAGTRPVATLGSNNGYGEEFIRSGRFTLFTQGASLGYSHWQRMLNGHNSLTGSDILWTLTGDPSVQVIPQALKPTYPIIAKPTQEVVYDWDGSGALPVQEYDITNNTDASQTLSIQSDSPWLVLDTTSVVLAAGEKVTLTATATAAAAELPEDGSAAHIYIQEQGGYTTTRVFNLYKRTPQVDSLVDFDHVSSGQAQVLGSSGGTLAVDEAAVVAGGVHGNAYDTSIDTDGLTIGHDVIPSPRHSSMTLSFWINSNGAITSDVKLLKGAMGGSDSGTDLDLDITNNGASLKLEWQSTGLSGAYEWDESTYDYTQEGAVSITPGTWHHVAIVLEYGGSNRLFFDGQLVEAVPHVGYTYNFDDLVFANGFDGLIDELQSFNYAMSDAEVLAQYSRSSVVPVAPAYDGLVAAGDVAFDWSEVSGAVSYELFVSANKSEVDDANSGLSAAWAGSVSEVTQAVDVGDAVYWRVDAVMADSSRVQGTSSFFRKVASTYVGSTNLPPVVSQSVIDLGTIEAGKAFSPVDLTAYVVDPEGGELLFFDAATEPGSYGPMGGAYLDGLCVHGSGYVYANEGYSLSGKDGVQVMNLKAVDDSGQETYFALTFDVQNGGTIDFPDADSDGLSDEDEAVLGTLVNNRDSDNDGFNDGFEVQEGTDPLNVLDVPVLREGLISIDIQGDGSEQFWGNIADPLEMTGTHSATGLGNVWNIFSLRSFDANPPTNYDVNPQLNGLVDSDGKVTRTGMLIDGRVTAWSGVNEQAAGDAMLEQDSMLLKAIGADESVTLSLSGLVPGESYNLYFFGDTAEGKYDVDLGNGAVRAVMPPTAMVTTANDAGKIVATISTASGESEAGVTGIQIVGKLSTDMVAVPNLAGLSQSAAISAVEAVGFTATVVEQHSDSVAIGELISYTGEGITAPSGSEITLIYSLGALNIAPVVDDLSVTVAENGIANELVGTVTANDANGDTLSYQIIAGNSASLFVIDANGNIMTTAGLDFESVSQHVLTVEVSDGSLTDTAQVTVNVSDVFEVVDSDNDGFPDALETAEGSDPNSDTSTPLALYQDLVLNLRLDGDLLDSSGYGHDAEAFGGEVYQSSADGQSITIDGTHYLRIADGADSPEGLKFGSDTDFTVSFLIKAPNGWSSDPSFVSNKNWSSGASTGWIIAGQNDSTQYQWNYRGADASRKDFETGGVLNDGDWHLVTVTHDRDGNAIFYRDGVQVGQVSIAGSGSVDSGMPIHVGRDGTGGYIMNGSIEVDNISIWKRALTGPEVAELFTLNEVNAAPVADDSAFNLAENGAANDAVGSVTANDVDGDTLSYQITAGNDAGLFAIDANGAVITTAALDYETASQYVLTVEVSDGELTDTATVTVNVDNVNEAPSASDANGNLAENGSAGEAVATVAASDPDAGTSLSYQITAGNAAGLFAIDANGNITTTAGLDFESASQHVLTVEVSDGELTDTAVVTIDVSNANEAPVASDIAGGVNENLAGGQVIGTLGVSDADAGDSFGYAITAGNGLGFFAIDTNGQVTTTSALDFETASGYALTVTVTDAGGLSDTAQVNVTVNNVNEAPTASNASGSVAEDGSAGAVIGTVATSDPDGDNLSYQITGGNGSGHFAIDSNGQVTTTGALDHEAASQHVLTVEVSDGEFTDTAQVTVNVTDVNEAPTASNASGSVAENGSAGAVIGTVATSDPEGDSLTYQITAGNGSGHFAIDSNGQVTTTGALDHEAASQHVLTVEVSDGELTDTAQVTVDVTDVNEAPTASNASGSVAENGSAGAVIGTVATSDPEGDNLTYQITGGNGSGHFAIDANGQVTTTGALDHEAASQHVLIVEVSDGEFSDTAQLTVNVTDVNEAPVAVADTAIVDEDGSVVVSVLDNDTDVDSVLSVESVTQGANGSVVTNGTTVTYTPSPEFYGNDSFTYTVSDGALTATATVSVTVNQVHEDLAVGDVIAVDLSSVGGSAAKYNIMDFGNGSLAAGSVVKYADGVTIADQVSVTLDNVYNNGGDDGGSTWAGTAADAYYDSDADDIVYNAPQNPITVTFTGLDDALSYNARVYAIYDDGNGGTDTYTVTNGAEVATSVMARADRMASATLEEAGGVFRAISTDGNGTIQVGVQVTAGSGWTGFSAVVLEVVDPNSAPILDDVTLSIAENGSANDVVGSVVGNDIDNDTLSYAITAGNEGGLFAIDSATGTITATGVFDYEATAQYVLSVEVSDYESSDSSQVTIDVTDANEAPTASNASGSVAENGSAGAVIGTVATSDPEGDSLTYQITGGNGSGHFAIDSDGQVTTTGALDFESASQHVLSVEVSDGEFTDTAEVTANVSNVNEAPVANNTSGSVSEAASIGTTVVSVAASDPDAGASLNYSITAGNTGNAFSIDSNGNVKVASALDYETTTQYTLTVQVSDGSLSDTAQVTVAVTDVVEVTVASIATGASSNITQESADIAYSISDEGNEAPTITVFYGETDGGQSAAAWDSSVNAGVQNGGSYVEQLVDLTEGTEYYYTVRAVNSAGEAWGSVSNFTTEADTSPKLVRATVAAVSSTSWTTVDLGQNYNSAVIVATPIYPDTTTVPAVTRIRNVSGSSFELKLDRTDGQAGAVALDVSVVAVEEGVYTLAADGVQMEAVKYTSTVTGNKSNWSAEARSFQNSYTTPVVVGQVMSTNDANWSVFWSMGSSRTNPVDAANLNVGKHVGEDPTTVRADETVGYIVIESGSGSINGVAYEAGLGSDTVRSFGNSATPYSYSLTGGLSSASAAALSISGMDGADGAWAVLSGATPLSGASVQMHVLEDQMNDTDNAHTTTQVGYLIFE